MSSDKKPSDKESGNSEPGNKEPGNGEKVEQGQAEMERVEDQAPAEAAGENGVDSDLETVREELRRAREDVLRSRAEMQNLRRRTERDVANAHKFALEKFVGELLPVVDNLERALASKEAAGGAAEDNDAVRQGIELTLKSFIDALKRFQVEQVAPLGEPFDPELHQAMSMVPNPDMENNSVLEVFQKGYTLNGRLVRPAMVVVVKN